MKSSPIYSIIKNPSRKADCSFGSSDTFTQDIRVGTSASNSHTLGVITVEREVDNGGMAVFSMYHDGELLKQGVLAGKQYTPLIGRYTSELQDD